MAQKTKSRPLTAEGVKTALRNQGLTIKQWAIANDYDYDTVLKVINGTRKGNYGVGHDIAVKLGMKIVPTQSKPARFAPETVPL